MSSENIQNTNEFAADAVMLPFGFETDSRGMIHWVYHKKLWQTVYLPVRAALFAVFFGAVAAGLSYLLTKSTDTSLMIGAVMGCAAVLSFLIWAVAVLMKGGEECLKMGMDEERVISSKLPRASRWARTLQEAAEPYGIMSNDIRIVVAGLNRVSAHNKVSKFDEVTEVRLNMKRDYVSVKTGMTENRICARPEQLDFVFDFIALRCTKAKIKRN